MEARNLVALVCFSLAGATLPSCTEANASREVNVESTSLSTTPWNDLGEGVYTFEFDRTWPAALVKFRKEHPDLTITAMYADREREYGITAWIVIVTEKR